MAIKTKKKEKKLLDRGRVYISATFNNTLVTVTDELGSPLLTGSCGMYGFAGTRKSTPFAATVVVQETLRKAMDQNGIKSVAIYIKGIGPGRNASLKAVRSVGLDVEKILDMTPIPHNGVRPPKQRRG